MRNETLTMNSSELVGSQNTTERTSANATPERVEPSWSNDELRNALAAILHDRLIRIEMAGGIVRHHYY